MTINYLTQRFEYETGMNLYYKDRSPIDGKRGHFFTVINNGIVSFTNKNPKCWAIYFPKYTVLPYIMKVLKENIDKGVFII